MKNKTSKDRTWKTALSTTPSVIRKVIPKTGLLVLHSRVLLWCRCNKLKLPEVGYKGPEAE